MATDKNLSVIVPSQFPSFVQDEYTKFISFVEAYYEYMEQSGKLIDAQRNLTEYFDIDSTLDELVDHFRLQYMPLFGTDVAVDKKLLVKNIKDFYRAKGSEKSMKFLFRALFNEEITLFYPNRQILRTSDGKWFRERAIRVTDNFVNIFEGDGVANTFILSDEIFDPNPEDRIRVKIDDGVNPPTTLPNTSYTLTNLLTPGGTGRSLEFPSPPTYGNRIIVEIIDGDYSKLVGEQVFGDETGASATIRKYQRVYDKGVFFHEYTISDLTKEFVLGEYATAPYIDETNNVAITVGVPLTSSVIAIYVTEAGRDYKVGDVVLIEGGGGTGAKGRVTSILKAGIKRVEVKKIGAGFVPGVVFNVIGGGGQYAVIKLNGIDSSGNVHANTLYFSHDVINAYADIAVNSPTLPFSANSSANAQTTPIANTMNLVAFGLCGPINPSQVKILQAGENYTSLPQITLDSPVLYLDDANDTIFSQGNVSYRSIQNANVAIVDFGIVGSIRIKNAGDGYEVGDELLFINSPTMVGRGAAAAVTAVSNVGGIAKVEIQPPRLEHATANIANGSYQVDLRHTDLFNGPELITNVPMFVDRTNASIVIMNEYRTVNTAIPYGNYTKDGYYYETLNVTEPFTIDANNRRMGVLHRDFIGGHGYVQDDFPTVAVESANGANAQLEILAIIGDGELVEATAIQPFGAILTIEVTAGGSGYLTEPTVDFTQASGVGAAATAEIAGGYYQYPGTWTDQSGFLSGTNKLQDRRFYQFYSYVIKSRKTLDTFERVLKDLIHPLGLQYFAEYMTDVNQVQLENDPTIEYANTANVSSVTIIPGVPTAPMVTLVETLTSDSIALHFATPASNGGNNIVSYTANNTTDDRANGNGVYSNSNSISPITITNLTPATSHTFFVTAVNQVGRSANSNNSIAFLAS
jgi:hypothetical protein